MAASTPIDAINSLVFEMFRELQCFAIHICCVPLQSHDDQPIATEAICCFCSVVDSSAEQSWSFQSSLPARRARKIYGDLYYELFIRMQFIISFVSFFRYHMLTGGGKAGVQTCDANIDGGLWTLVRHTNSGWHPANDALSGTD